MDVSVIIVNYNTKEITEACIDSIMKFTLNLKYEIILIDNSSTDGSQTHLKNTFTNIILIESRVNLGFGKANNLGVKHAKGDFLFFLNSDTLLVENSIKKIYDFYVANQNKLNIGVLGCQLLNMQMTMANSGGIFPTPLNDIYLYFEALTQKFFKFRIKKKKKDISFIFPYSKIDMVSGADMFIEKCIFERVNGFDKDFFLYYEETDLQKRISNLGYKNFLLSITRIIHLEGSSFGRDNKIPNFKRIIIQESRNKYFRKHHSITYYFYVFIDSIINCTRLFNNKYSFSDNKQFVLKNIKSYF